MGVEISKVPSKFKTPTVLQLSPTGLLMEDGLEIHSCMDAFIHSTNIYLTLDCLGNRRHRGK